MADVELMAPCSLTLLCWGLGKFNQKGRELEVVQAWRDLTQPQVGGSPMLQGGLLDFAFKPRIM